MDQHPDFRFYRWRQRTKAWNTRAREAIWARIPDGKVGDVVVLMRTRARDAKRRANGFFGLLMASIVAGFLFYIGYPEYIRTNDAAVQSRHLANDIYQGLISELEATRADLVARIDTDLSRAGLRNQGPEAWDYISVDAVVSEEGEFGYLHDRVGDYVVISGDPSKDATFLLSPRFLPTYVNYSKRIGKFVALAGDDSSVLMARTADALAWQTFNLILPVEGATATAVASIADDTVIVAYELSAEAFQSLVNQPVELRPEAATAFDVVIPEAPGFPILSRSRYGLAVVKYDPAADQNELAMPNTTDADIALDIEMVGAVTQLRELANGQIGILQDAGFLSLYDPGSGQSQSTSLLAPSGLRDVAFDGSGDEKSILVAGDFGFLTRIDADLNRNEPVQTTPPANRYARVLVNQSSGDWWLVEDGEFIHRSTNKGVDWETFLLWGATPVRDAAIVGDALFVVDGASNILQFPPSGASKLVPVLSNGSEGDKELEVFFEEMDQSLAAHSVMQAHISEFERQRIDPQLEAEIRANNTAISRFNSRGYYYDDQAERAQAYLKDCLPSMDATQAHHDSCLKTFETILAQESGDWWEAVARNAPPGILLLFLLSTMGGLYRYNLRVSGFYHARADLLELIGADGDLPKDVSAADLMSILASEKVEFGKAAAPSDQAVDIFKTIASRLPGSV